MRIRVAALLFLGGVACDSGSNTDRRASGSGASIVISSSADPDILFPALTMSAQGKQITDQVFDNLADVGASLNVIGDDGFTPRLATSWRWAPDSSWIEFSIDPRARWHDGTQVSSADVAFTFALVKDSQLGSTLASNLSDVDSVTASDSLTARVWLSSHPPTLFYRVAGSIPVLPFHLLRNHAAHTLRASEFARRPVGSGRFRFHDWKPGQSVTLIADSSNYRGRPRAGRVVWLVAPDYNAAALRFLAGEADFLDVVKPEFVAQASSNGRRVETSVPSLNYGYVSFNLRSPKGASPHRIFSNRDVRRALVMSIDRDALVRNVLDTLGSVAHGPVTRALPTYDGRLGLPYDTASAARMLDSAGWRRGADGIRTRSGRRLAFKLLVPTSSANRMKFATLLQDQWKRIGADVAVEAVELSTFGARLESKDFDAMLNAWQIDPDPGSVRDEWMGAATRPSGMNFTSYSNPDFDATVDSAARAVLPEDATRLYRHAYAILTDDAAAMWLYESRNAFGISRRLQPVGLRADAWWANLPEWRVSSQ